MKDDESHWRGWRSKTDEQIADAASHLSDYTEERRKLILEEFHFRELGDPPATKSPNDESSLPVGNRHQAKLKTPAITTGITILIVGVALIIISPSLRYVEYEHVPGGGFLSLGREQIIDLRDAAKFCGVALLIVGGIISAAGFGQFMSTQPTPPSAPTTQPVVTQSVSPKSIELGNTPDEVQSVMGQPDKIINLGARVIHVYKDMNIIYVDGKVSDVQLS